MAIKLDSETTDAIGFPIVGWTEDRNLFAPGGLGQARVVCFIKPDPATGRLMFASRGDVRHGAFEEARPWEALRSFRVEGAEQYYAPGEKAALEVLSSKSKSGLARLALTDGAHVMVASFEDDRPSLSMHLNCAECAPVEMTVLHDRLLREFIGKRHDIIERLCGGVPVWPNDENGAPLPYNPPHVPQNTAGGLRWWAEWIVALVIVGGALFGIFYFLLRM